MSPAETRALWADLCECGWHRASEEEITRYQMSRRKLRSTVGGGVASTIGAASGDVASSILTCSLAPEWVGSSSAFTRTSGCSMFSPLAYPELTRLPGWRSINLVK